jgi:sugar phosphate isomerase/epimerase
MPVIDRERRNLLKIIGIGAVALSLPKRVLAGRLDAKPNIGLQLYTVRKAIETDFEGTMRKVADIGFIGIESYALPAGLSLERAAKVFRDLDLKVLGMHIELPTGTVRDDTLHMADLYQCDRAVYHGWPEEKKYDTPEAIGHMVDVYNEASAFFAERGLRFGLHNHWWDFELHAGFYPFPFLLEQLDKKIFFEIDTYWAKTAGQDPAQVVKKFGARAPLLHIKDGPAIKGEQSYKQVPVGSGVMDFPAIAMAADGNTEWMIVEFDEYDGDMLEGVKKSYAYLTGNGLALGKV